MGAAAQQATTEAAERAAATRDARAERRAPSHRRCRECVSVRTKNTRDRSIDEYTVCDRDECSVMCVDDELYCFPMLLVFYPLHGDKVAKVHAPVATS